MKVATFNVENLFDRAKILNLESWSEGQPILNAYSELNGLFEKEVYSDALKTRIVQLIQELGLEQSDESKYVLLRKIRGQLLRRSSANGLQVVASGRRDWIGWLELKDEPVNETAIMNTGRVIRDVGADILAVVEAENRVALEEFSEYVLNQVDGTPYDKVMMIDGNDRRGIDVALMLRKGYDFGPMRSHVHDRDARGEPIFSRDCPEFSVITPEGEVVWCLVNHFKSKGYGNPAANNARRKAQAERVAMYYNRLKTEGAKNVIVLGDLNDTPASAPLKPLLVDTDLKDISEHPAFDTGEWSGKGTYGLGADNDKIDYLLLSPALFERVTAGGIFRKGAWPGVRPPRWTVYPEIELKIHVASDHHALWAEID